MVKALWNEIACVNTKQTYVHLLCIRDPGIVSRLVQGAQDPVWAQSTHGHHAKHGHVRRVAPHQSHDEGRRNDVASTQRAATGVGESTPTLPAQNSTTGKPISKIWLTTPTLPAQNSTTDKTISSIWFPASEMWETSTAHKGGPTHGSFIEHTSQTTSPTPRATSALAYRCRQPTPCPCG